MGHGSGAPMKFLIVNGDDFGASRGTNRGIVEAHQRGILTSTSLMVNAPAVRDAVDLSRTTPKMSVGLHIDLSRKELPGNPAKQFYVQLCEQVDRFHELMRRPPTHVDSHHNVHRSPELLP